MQDNDVIIAAEPIAAYSMTSYTDVMNYLHSIHISPEDKERVAKRLNVEVTGKNLSRAYARLEHLASLRHNWDGEGALRISHRVLNNMKKVLLISDDVDWENWVIGPDSNATLGLQSKSTRACISIGATEFSYFARINGKRFGESHVAFTPEVFLKIMREIG